MTDVREATASLLADRPALESDLRSVLAVDDEHDTWTFDDVPVDSGAFGELVSSGVVEKVDGEYRIADRAAVRSVLRGDELPDDTESTRRFEWPSLGATVRDVPTVLVAAVVALLGLVVVMRTAFSWTAVFRGQVVLLGNDPYYYQHVIESIVQTDASVGDRAGGEVLLLAVLSEVASLLGGTPHDVALVLAWYPIVAAVLVGTLVYATAVLTFDDYRVGLASLGFYAVTPIVAYRSALGFGDHHAFDYLLVTLAVTGLVALAGDRRDWRTITTRRVAGFLGLGAATPALVHAWRGGPLLLLPVGAYVALGSASVLRDDESPLQEHAWILGALAVGAVLAVIPHVLLDWVGTTRAIAPTLLFGGSLIAVLTAELAHRREVGARSALGTELVVGGVTAAAAWLFVPVIHDPLQRGLAFFVRTGQSNISETASILSPEYGVIATPVFYLGFAFFFGVAALAWACWRVTRDHQPAWLALSVYTAALFVGALVQLRFAGQFAIVLSVFVGLSFVYLVAAVDATALPRPFADDDTQTGVPQRFRTTGESSAVALPDRESAFAVVALFLLVGSMGILQTAGGTADLTVDGSSYDAAVAIDDHAAETNRTWPQNYVFSDWGNNRFYNYLVNGHSESYAYARGNYQAFLSANDSALWYERLASRPTGYVVVTDADTDADVPQASLQNRLWEHEGSATSNTAGVGHYRLVYANDDRKVYDLVPGAMVVGRGDPGKTATVSTQIRAGGRTRTFERRATTTANGWYAVRVPYSGTYDVSGERVTVSNDSVATGTFTSEPAAGATWPLNASTGDVAFDVTGGHHGRIDGATWAADGGALSFDGDGVVSVPTTAGISGDDGVSLSVSFRTAADTNYTADVRYPRLAGTARSSAFRNTSGYQLALSRGRIVAALGNGPDAAVLVGPRVDDDQRHTARLEWTGERVRLVLDGEVVRESSYTGPVGGASKFALGASADGNARFTGTIFDASVSNSSQPSNSTRP